MLLSNSDAIMFAVLLPGNLATLASQLFQKSVKCSFVAQSLDCAYFCKQESYRILQFPPRALLSLERQ